MMKPIKDLPLISMREYGLYVFIILFLCVSVIFIGISCDEQPQSPAEHNTICVSKTDHVLAKDYMSEEGRKVYDHWFHYNPPRGRMVALLMIEKHLGEMVELMKEHECLSK